MVQRKAPPKISPQDQTKKSHVKLERQTSSLHQEDRGGDLKKKMKLERSFRAAADLEILQDYPMKQQSKKRSPNYMKPTSSSDARKEKLQVTPHPQPSTDHKTRSPKNSKNSNSSKTSTSSSPSSHPSHGLKLTKSLSRQSSLKAIRPLIKRNLNNLMKGVAVNRATCSSTMKNLKFPEALDLNPGGTEADGTSVMRVCPYTYCSLNGHRHEALPPLKCFMSARRKLLKTQKSLKLKEASLLRLEVLGKEEIDTGQKATGKVSSISLEEPDDFFVEIYASGGVEEQIVDEKSQAEDETEEFQCLKEPCEGEIVEDVWDQNSEVSNEDVDAMVCSLEYVECDQEADDANEEKGPCEEDDEELQVECHVVGLSEKDYEGEGESESKASTFEFSWEEEVGSPYPDNMTECSEISTDNIALLNACDGAQADEEQQQEANQDVAEEDNVISAGNEPVAIAEADAELKQEVDSKVTEIHDATAEEPEDDVNTCCYLCDSKQNISDTSFQGEGFSEKEEEGIEAGHALREEVGSPYPDNTTECFEISTEHIALLNACDEAQANEEQQQEANQDAADEDNEISVGDELVTVAEADAGLKQEVDCKLTEIHDAMAKEPEDDVNTCCFRGEGLSEKEEECTEEGHALPEVAADESNEDDGPEEQQGLLKENTKGQENENEVEDTDSFSIDDLKESGQCITEDEGSQNWPHIVFKCDEGTEDADTSDTQSCSSNGQSDDSDIEESWESEVSLIGGSTAKSNARIMIGRRKKMEEELDEMREFNPRSPRFLDVEPDPEAEKVDLRHQEMDGRKNSEEYLIDYALQQAVTKLAPARKRKVALLVEAFETVMPLPVCEKPLRHSSSGFIHARIMQACI